MPNITRMSSRTQGAQRDNPVTEKYRQYLKREQARRQRHWPRWLLQCDHWICINGEKLPHADWVRRRIANAWKGAA